MTRREGGSKVLTPSLLRVCRAARSAPRRLLPLVSWFAVALLAALVLLPTGVNLSGRQVLVVLSGSMEPTFSAGDVVLVSPADSGTLRPGQVISYRAPGSDQLTTHRIVSLRTIKGDVYVQTRGDANSAPDPDFTPAGNVAGVMGATVPYAGFALQLVNDPQLRLVAFGLPLLFSMLGAGRELLRAAPRPSRRTPDRPAGDASASAPGAPHRHLRPRLRLVALGLVPVLVVSAVAVASTGAVLTDTSSVGDNSFSTAPSFSQ